MFGTKQNFGFNNTAQFGTSKPGAFSLGGQSNGIFEICCLMRIFFKFLCIIVTSPTPGGSFSGFGGK